MKRIALAVIPTLTLNFAFSQEEVVEPIEVIGVSPLHGIGVSEDKFPSYVESESFEEIESQRTINLTDYMGLKFGSVYTSTDRSEPFQNVIFYRGFTSSWLIGQPQGISIYLDGVRMNEPFSDVINWDAIPDRAVDTMNLFSGSNPIFGLNSLGGAISLQTKRAFTFPRKEIGIYFGSFQRRSFWAEGGYIIGEKTGIYVMGETVRGKGWRDLTLTDINRGFVKLSHLLSSGVLEFSFLGVDNEIHSSDVLLEKFLSLDREMAFTGRDIYKNDSYLVTHRGNYQVSKSVIFDWNVYYKNSRFGFFSGDITEFEVEEECDNKRCLVDEETEQPVIDKNGNFIFVADGQIPGIINRTFVDQKVYGGALQASLEGSLGKMGNKLSVGFDFYKADADYIFDMEFGIFRPNREVAGTGVLLSHPQGEEDDIFYRDVNGENTVYGVYFMNIFTPLRSLDVFLGGRYNHAELKLEDRTGFLDDISGTNTYKRFNPMVGFSLEFYPKHRFYASYFESNRTPTPIEIACSDPNEPCRLPSAFVEDPPLKQVVGKTVEVGVKGYFKNLEWSLSLFNIDLEDDILPVAGGEVGQIFFKNVDKTRRRGVELSFEGNLGRFELFGGYTLILAEFRTPEWFSSPNHPKVLEVCDGGGTDPEVDCDTGAILAKPGDRIPGIPEHNVKLGMNYRITSNLTGGINLIYSSGVYLIGDEANLDRKTDPYTVVNLVANYRKSNLTVFARVDNIFDTKYETTGRYVSLEEAAELNPILPEPIDPDKDNPRALAPGAPRNFIVGVAYTF